MGYYINTGTVNNKAQIIAREYGGLIVSQPAKFSDVPEDMALICVVDNGLFEAAGYCYSEQEFKVFSDKNDPRPKKWIMMDKSKAETLSNYKR